MAREKGLCLMLGGVRNYDLANTVSFVLDCASLKAGIYDSVD
jgi:hypothetical protein